MGIQRNPLVSIGIPVFNGEKGLSNALDSLLSQDYSNMEIIISDNASTDSTPEICAQYVQKDRRITYYRSEKNRGVIWNCNRVCELSNGEYFMWAAHDDQREPFFVSECVKRMEESPKAAVCQAYTAVHINEEILCIVKQDSFEKLTGWRERYRETLRHFPSTISYGLYRLSLMRKTPVFSHIIAADVGFIQELSLQGDFVQVPKILFNYFGREKWNTLDQDYHTFFGKKKKPWWYLPFVVLFCHHFKRVMNAPIPFIKKVGLYSVLLQHEVGMVILKLLIRLAGLFLPMRWKEKVGCAIYWRWMHSPNIEVRNANLYLERVIKPRLGWWR